MTTAQPNSTPAGLHPILAMACAGLLLYGGTATAQTAEGTGATADPIAAADAAMTSATPGDAAATAAAPSPSAGAAAGAQLQEVLVTATRREEDINKVPISITAMTQATIDQLGVQDFQDMAKYTPGVNIDTSGTNNISIRGIAATGGADTTGIYIDDTPVQTRTGFDVLPEAFDIDRIEVLRGPQGTLFGAGSEGGTVRYITTQPSLTETSFYSRDQVSYTQGGANSYQIGVAGGTPLIDGVLGVRLTLFKNWDGGWVDRIDPTYANGAAETPGGPYDVVDSNTNRAQDFTARLAFLWQPVQGLQITPAVYYQDRTTHDYPLYWPLYSNPSANQEISADPLYNPTSDDFTLTSLKIDGDLGFAHLISNSAIMDRDTLGVFSGYEPTLYNLGFYQDLMCESASGAFIPPCPLLNGSGVHLPSSLANYRSPSPIYQFQNTEMQELRLQSSDTHALFVWTAGFFFNINRIISQNPILDPDLAALTELLTGETVAQFFTVPLVPNALNTGDPTSWYNWEKTIDRQYALFGEATINFTDQWKATVGVRESWLAFNFESLTEGPQEYGTAIGAGGESKSPFTPKVNLSFQATPDQLYYATYARGFRAGGANSPIPYAACALDFKNFDISGAPLTFNPDTTSSYEIGTKENIENRIQIASSIYYINWNNIQQEVTLPICEIGFISNLGQAVAKGADFQLDYALTENFQFNVDAGYTQARYVRSSRITPEEATPVVSDGDAIEGASGQPAPPFTGTIGFQYRFTAYGEQLFFHMDDSYSSRNPWLSPAEDATTAQYDPTAFTLSSTNIVDLRTGVFHGPSELDFFVNNLTDSHPVNWFAYSVNPDNGVSRLEQVQSFRPRTFGLEFFFRK